VADVFIYHIDVGSSCAILLLLLPHASARVPIPAGAHPAPPLPPLHRSPASWHQRARGARPLTGGASHPAKAQVRFCAPAALVLPDPAHPDVHPTSGAAADSTQTRALCWIRRTNSVMLRNASPGGALPGRYQCLPCIPPCMPSCMPGLPLQTCKPAPARPHAAARHHHWPAAGCAASCATSHASLSSDSRIPPATSAPTRPPPAATHPTPLAPRRQQAPLQGRLRGQPRLPGRPRLQR
jgi:hypothetical protein